MSLFGIFVVVGGGEIDAGTSLKRGEESGGDAGSDPGGHSVELLIGQAGALILHGYGGFLLPLACLGSSVETHTKSAKKTMEEGSNRKTIFGVFPFFNFFIFPISIIRSQ